MVDTKTANQKAKRRAGGEADTLGVPADVLTEYDIGGGKVQLLVDNLAKAERDSIRESCGSDGGVMHVTAEGKPIVMEWFQDESIFHAHDDKRRDGCLQASRHPLTRREIARVSCTPASSTSKWAGSNFPCELLKK